MPPRAHYPVNDLSWSRHRGTIERLYYLDGLSLERVMGTMAKEYGFKATVKMYKIKIKAWGLSTYSKGSLGPRRRRADSSKSRGKISGSVTRKQHRADFTSPRAIEITKNVLNGNRCARNPSTQPEKLVRGVVFNTSTEHFLHTTKHYIEVSLKTGPWRSVPSLLTPQGSPAMATPESETAWELNVLDHSKCGSDRFFTDMLASVCFAANNDYNHAGERWRSAFRAVESSIKREDTELLVALLWSIELLDRMGCAEVVSSLQRYVSNLVKPQVGGRSRPFFVLLDSFARIDLDLMPWIRGLVLRMVIDCAAAASQKDNLQFKAYAWSSFPAANGVFRVVSTKFTAFDQSTKNMNLVDSSGDVSDRLIFVARKERMF